jgi:hypothetical protein
MSEIPVISQQKSSYLQIRRRLRKELLHAKKRLLAILVNSTAIFVLSYLMVYLVTQLITMGVAALLGIHSSLRYFEIFYHIPNNSSLWTLGRVIIVSVTAPFLSLLTGLVLLYGVIRIVDTGNYGKMFIFWTGYHTIIFFFGGILAGAATGRGMGYPMDYAFWPRINVYLLFGLFCVFFLGFFGYNNSSQFLRISPSKFWVKRKYRKQYLFFSLILPWLIGTFVFFIIKFPNQIPLHENIFLHDFILSSSMIFLLIPMFFNNKPIFIKPVTTSHEGKTIPFMFYVIIVVSILLIFRIFLS